MAGISEKKSVMSIASDSCRRLAKQRLERRVERAEALEAGQEHVAPGPLRPDVLDRPRPGAHRRDLRARLRRQLAKPGWPADLLIQCGGLRAPDLPADDAELWLVLASGVAFLLSEFADLGVYTPLARRRLVLAVVASSVVGLVVDSIVFLWLAFGSLDVGWVGAVAAFEVEVLADRIVK